MLVPLFCIAAARSHTIGFWIIAHDEQPELAIVNRQTWLRDEPLVHCVVDAAANVSAELAPHLKRLRTDCPRPSGVGKSIEGTHARCAYMGGGRNANGSSCKRGTQAATTVSFGRVNVYLRRKVGRMISAMCAAREDFAVMLDEDTAINATRLREWIHTEGHSPDVPLYTGSASNLPHGGDRIKELPKVGGGPGIVFSRAGLQALCSAGCEPQSCSDAAIRHCHDVWSSTRPHAVRKDGGGCAGGDHWVGVCAHRAGLPAVDNGRYFSKFPSWTMSDSHTRIGMHRMRPAKQSLDFAPDPRCRIISSGAAVIVVRQTHRCAPYFAIIGSPKAGTTSLYDYLSQHPQVRRMWDGGRAPRGAHVMAHTT